MVRSKCLNRTMQYGNFFIEKNKEKKTEFKSYYVVWKPQIMLHYTGAEILV